MFTYSLASDLHMDTGHAGVRLKDMNWEKNIIIAGDLGNGLSNFSFIEKLARKGHRVFAVDGNHEHYANKAQKRTLEETERSFYEHMGRIWGADRQPQLLTVDEGIYLIGTNGWYIVEDEDHWRGYMNDSKHGALSAATVNDAAKRHADFIGNHLVRLPHDAKAIVVTHTAPCYESLDPRFAHSSGNPYYVNPLMEDVMTVCAKQILVWHHGHTHAPVDVRHAGVQVLTNPRGYPGEVKGWRPLTCQA